MSHKKIVFVQTTLGHYEHARLLDLAQYCQGEGFAFLNIELSGSIRDYPWFRTTVQQGYSNLSLFPSDKLDEIPEKKLWRALKDCLEKLEPDVVFLAGYSLSILRKAKIWCERRKIATVLISDSNEFDKRRYTPVEFLKSLFVRRFDAAFVAGQSSSVYIQHLGIPKERIAFGCDVVDVKKLAEQAVCSRKHIFEIRQRWNLPLNYFLFVGRMIPEKNIIGLLAAFEQFLRKKESNGEWHLVICGAGGQEKEIEVFLKNLSSEDQSIIHLPGFVEPDRLVDFYSAASYLVLPSISETWGLVVNEAMACSLPVIVSKRAGSSFDLVREGENGWTIDPFDTEMMSNVLGNAANMDERTREKFGQKSRALITNWDLDLFSRGVVESSRMALAHAQHKYRG
ncbi:MAG TPA: glycosyltransferase family 4 protein [Anaerolineales bacterium]|nr:glycosyltransferase family 4 protein [Anaerolineales bacterium]